MANTLDERGANQDALEEIHNTLVAASTKLAQLQLDVIDDAETAEIVGDAMNDLSPILESVESLARSYQMETNRLENEG